MSRMMKIIRFILYALAALRSSSEHDCHFTSGYETSSVSGYINLR